MKLAVMRWENMLVVSCAVVMVGSLTAVPRALAGEETKPAPSDVRPGEIVIKRTGTRRVVTARAAAPQADDVPSDRPGPRNVTIGYQVREPGEMGGGPIEYAPASPYLPRDSDAYYGYGEGYEHASGGYGTYGYPLLGYRTFGYPSYGSSSCGSARYGSCLPSYGAGYGRSSFGTRSFTSQASRVNSATRHR